MNGRVCSANENGIDFMEQVERDYEMLKDNAYL